MTTPARSAWFPATMRALVILSVVALATLPYLQTIGSYFLGDDFGLVREFSRQDWLYFLSLFSQSWDAGVYGDIPDELRPLIALSYQFDFFWGSGSAAAFHISNIAFHALNAALVFGLARVAARLDRVMSVLVGVSFAIFPIHAETVSWISGRADSIPAIFYLGSFLAFAAWRRARGGRWLYGISVVLFFFALFSKQYAITMLGTIILYDVLVLRVFPRPAWNVVRIYLPFAVLTVSYLALRYVLFGNFVREDAIGLRTLLRDVVLVQERNLEVLVFGYFVSADLPSVLRQLMRAGGSFAIFGLAVVPAYFELRRRSELHVPTRIARLIYFGPVWWLLSVAPLAVTYYTPRHLYLAAAGLAITLGLGLEALRSVRQPIVKALAAAAAIGLLAGCFVLVEAQVGNWNTSAAISAKMAQDVQTWAADAPPGTLLVLGGSPIALRSQDEDAFPAAFENIYPPPGAPWLWSFALPYAVQPPFAPPELAERVTIIGPSDVYCCRDALWVAATRRSIAAWAARGAPLHVLAWNRSTGALLEQSDADNPCRRGQILDLLQSTTTADMQQGLQSVIRQVRSGPTTTGTLDPNSCTAQGGLRTESAGTPAPNVRP